jgi:hypothetical protein
VSFGIPVIIFAFAWMAIALYYLSQIVDRFEKIIRLLEKESESHEAYRHL